MNTEGLAGAGTLRKRRDWLRSLAVTGDGAGQRTDDAVFSGAVADDLGRTTADGTLEAALNEIAAEPELAG